MPAVITALDGSTFGFERPGLQITPFDAGPHRSRDWLGYNLRSYNINPSVWQSSTTALEEWSAFWHHIDGGGGVGYIMEPVSEAHRNLVCGGIADGSQTTFPIPVKTPTSVTVFVDGVPQESSAYTVHSAANLLGDDDLASCVDSADWSTSNGSDATAAGVSLDGISSNKVIPSGAGVPRMYHLAIKISGFSAGETYTGIVSVLPTAATSDNYRAELVWFTTGDAYISSSTSTYTATPPGAWTTYSITATAPATTAKAVMAVQREDTGTEPFYGDCFALCPGDYTRWHLPSQAPGLVEFASAPAAGARITATATGQRVTRCRFEPGSSWSLSSAGHASSRSIRAIEDVEV
jgi:hypothetical protein